MPKCDYTPKRDNFLEYVLELRKLVSRIQVHRELLKDDFKNLHQLTNSLYSKTKKSAVFFIRANGIFYP